MIKRKLIMIGIVILLATLFLSACSQEGIQEGYFPGDQAYDFTLPTLAGDDVTLSDLNGKAVLIVFWASW
jgi:cytochrome oxidase Cu insertion factor (SCO1/SenC/PrrC family)